MSANKRIVVTGGSGFIGAHLCHELKQQGNTIVILDLVEPRADIPHDCFIQGDIRDVIAVREALEGCDEILHLAAAHHDFGIDEKTYFDVNEEGLRVITGVMDELSMRRIVFYSTVAVYGTAMSPLSEETPPQPESFYGKSKLAGEKVLETWIQQGNDRQCLIIRPTVTYGKNNFANMYSLLRQIDKGRFFFSSGSKNIKSLSYIENIADATLYLMDKNDLPPFAVFNYIDKPDLTSVEIAEACYTALGKKIPRLRIPLWMLLFAAIPFDIIIALTGKNLPVSTPRIKKLFVDQTKFEAQKIIDAGFKAEASVRNGIERTATWYMEKGKSESAQWHQPPAEVFRK
ncbi:MAG: NAD(P)-dependent oxidoreductase [Planctomycetota bacterium]|nr:NAD(P)-dependent oxidoreductase [Planctomycetota bacterium]